MTIWSSGEVREETEKITPSLIVSRSDIALSHRVSMRILIAYAAVFLGIPLAGATLVWFLPRFFLITILRRVPNLEDAFTALIEGGLGSFLGCLIFHWLRVVPDWPVPLLLVGVGSYWHVARSEKNLILPFVVGLPIGYAVFKFIL